MSEIAKAMDRILGGQAQAMSGDVMAIAKVIEAAQILNESGYEDEAAFVIAALKDDTMTKVASSQYKEEILFEITE